MDRSYAALDRPDDESDRPARHGAGDVRAAGASARRVVQRDRALGSKRPG